MSEPRERAPDLHCPECGAAVKPDAVRCWLCYAELPAHTSGESMPLPAETAPPARGASFSLATVFLVTTSIAVWLGVTVQWPGLGILLAVLGAPALIRTIWISVQRTRSGLPLSPADKLLAFLGSLGLVVVLLVAIISAFFLTCLSTYTGLTAIMGGDELQAIGPALITGLVAGLAVGIVCGISIFKRRGRKVGGLELAIAVVATVAVAIAAVLSYGASGWPAIMVLIFLLVLGALAFQLLRNT